LVFQNNNDDDVFSALASGLDGLHTDRCGGRQISPGWRRETNLAKPIGETDLDSILICQNLMVAVRIPLFNILVCES
jgi:hypothetical protein